MSQTATLDFGIRYAILNSETHEYVSGKDYSYGGATRVMWSKDPVRARLFKSEGHAKHCAGYHPESCILVKVTLSAL